MPITAVLIVDTQTVLIERVADPLAWAKRVRAEINWFESFPAKVSGDADQRAEVIVWVDDMGGLTGSPANSLANVLLKPVYPLLGPVLLTGPANREGELTDIDDLVITKLLRE